MAVIRKKLAGDLVIATGNPMHLPDAAIRGLLQFSRETSTDELDCSEFLDCMARVAEAVAAGGAGASTVGLDGALVLALRHLRLCACCAEECDALVAQLGPGDPLGA